MFWPQVVRGVAIMFCLLPPTRLALGTLSPDKVADASGLFNLMRNLGGAIGIALIDTIIYMRSEPLSQTLWARLQSGNTDTAAFIGAPLHVIAGHRGTFDSDTTSLLDPLVQTAATVQALNEAWFIISMLTACGILILPFARRAMPPSR
jgi:DHA2 family multidrug resistance protein